MVLLAAGALLCLRLAWADVLYRSSTVPSVRRARELAPRRAACQARLAFLLGPTDPDAELKALERAAALNPRDSSVLMELGLRAEARGETVIAERYLLRAAAVDRTYAPRWTLANYYFRRSDRDNFRKWVRRSAEMAYGDMRPLFRLCWGLSSDAADIARDVVVNQEASRQYLVWLLSEDRLDAAAPVAEARARSATASDTEVLLYACDRFLQFRRVGEAVRTWNSLAAGDLIASQKLDPAHGISITNEAFEYEPTGRGFDWRMARLSGVTVVSHAAKQQLTASFSGRQAERCVPVWQYTPLPGGSRCRLDLEYRTDGIGPRTGLRWAVIDATTRTDRRLAESPALSSDTWTHTGFEFTTPGPLKLAKLALTYDRAPGTTRIEGSISIRRIRLRLLP